VANQSPSLYLPGRYQKDQQELERPLDYAEVDDAGKLWVVANSKDMETRIPLDELKDMLHQRQQKALVRGDAQRAADVNASLRDFWQERKNWIVSRRNNAIRYGWTPGTGK
jgi:uncharacterized circularly permuted ATP-grasp superfamily protein